MILYYILLFFDTLQMGFVDIIPAVSSPEFLVVYMPQIIEKIVAFNDYLPITEAFQTVIACLLGTLAWKILKVVLGVVNINLGS